jgi:very-short-patch-repair endonuclease
MLHDMQAQQGASTNGWHWPDLKSQVRDLRKQATPAEARLWNALRGIQLGVKFRRQHPIHRYVVDFYCVQAGLAIEIDGGVHSTQVAEDAARQAFLESNNIRFLRFNNDDVTNNLASVLTKIDQALQYSSPS